jgi:hypothetical protein
MGEVSSGNSPDCVSCGLASVCSSAAMAPASRVAVNVEPPVTTQSMPRARSASMYSRRVGRGAQEQRHVARPLPVVSVLAQPVRDCGRHDRAVRSADAP